MSCDEHDEESLLMTSAPSSAAYDSVLEGPFGVNTGDDDDDEEVALGAMSVFAKLEEADGDKLGTLMGVYVPCVVGVFGVIVYERLGWVVGQAGLWQALLMFLVGYTVVTLSVTSVAAIATNGKVKGGGTYFLISRTLGPEFGGSVGVVFFLANVAGCTFFLLGFSEALEETLPNALPYNRWWDLLYASILLAILVAICFVGASLFTKAASVFLVVVSLSLLVVIGSFMFRGADESIGFSSWNSTTLRDNVGPSYTGSYSFPTVFGVAFPTLTGILAGSNMSGDLREPGKAIGVGTFAAILTTGATYFFLIVLLASTTLRGSVESNVGLLGNYFIMSAVCVQGWIVSLGIVAAVISSALGTIVGGARVLQAVARDELLGPILSPFKRGSGINDEPRVGIIAMWVMVQCLLFMGDLNAVAPYITMFYLLAFLVTNLACFLLTVSGAPNWRPQFRFYHWSTALIGALMCIVIMFLVDALSAGIALAVTALLWGYIHIRADQKDWGDLSQALIFHQVRKYLLRLDKRKEHVKFWRPQILLMLANPRASMPLIDFVNALKKGGIFILGHVIPGHAMDEAAVEQHRELKSAWYDLATAAKLKAFVEVAINPNIATGTVSILSTSGLGAFEPNTVILGFHGEAPSPDLPADHRLSTSLVRVALERMPPPREADEAPHMDADQYVEVIKATQLWGKSLLIARHFNQLNRGEFEVNRRLAVHKVRRFIDVWVLTDEDWQSEQTMMYQIMLGLLLSTNDWWHMNAELRVLTFCEWSAERPRRQAKVEQLLALFRIRARTHVYALEEEDLGSYHAFRTRASKPVARPLSATSERIRIDGSSFEVLHRPNAIYEHLNRSDRMVVINELVRKFCKDSAVVFLPLPLPSNDPDDEYQSDDWVSDVTRLTDELGPTLLVNSMHEVMTTEL